MNNEEIAQMADATADKILEVGWRQNDYWEGGMDYKRYTGGSVCLVGAAALTRGCVQIGGDDNVFGDSEFNRVLSDYVGVQYIHSWNDGPGRTQDEVISMLRDVATKYRSDEMRVTND